MIMREWRGRVPHDKADAYEAFLHTSGIADYAATPGNLGIWLLVDRSGSSAEFTTLTLWESEEAIQRFAGSDIRLAHYYPEDDDFLLEKARHVRHYEVLWPAEKPPGK
jgi:heme-degrading monooxygenase HmoA